MNTYKEHKKSGPGWGPDIIAAEIAMMEIKDLKLDCDGIIGLRSAVAMSTSLSAAKVP